MPAASPRDEILKAGFHVIYENGLNGCTIEDIAKAAKIPKGSFFNHFKSKEEFAVEVLDMYFDSIGLKLLSDKSLTPLQRLDSHFAFMMQANDGKAMQHGCMAGNLAVEMADLSEPLREALARHFSSWHRLLAALLREAQAEGEASSALKPIQAARYLVSSWQGAVQSAKVNRSPQPLEDYLSTIFALLQPRDAKPARREHPVARGTIQPRAAARS